VAAPPAAPAADPRELVAEVARGVESYQREQTSRLQVLAHTIVAPIGWKVLVVILGLLVVAIVALLTHQGEIAREIVTLTMTGTIALVAGFQRRMGEQQ
jgi:hypothetical protein